MPWHWLQLFSVVHGGVEAVGCVDPVTHIYGVVLPYLLTLHFCLVLAGMNRLGIQVHNFAQMGEMESLVLASNKLLALHSSVWGLTTLKRLDLGHNNLSDLPSDVSSLTGLTVRRGTGRAAWRTVS